MHNVHQSVKRKMHIMHFSRYAWRESPVETKKPRAGRGFCECISVCDASGRVLDQAPRARKRERPAQSAGKDAVPPGCLQALKVST